MCEECAPAGGWTRREVLVAGGLAAAVLPLVSAARPAVALDRPPIHPRADWGPTAVAGPVPDEPDVRFLLVHHTVNNNTYAADVVPAMLRQIHAFHTGPEKNWPDIAYNFIVDRFGGIWETRAGSLERGVAGDATGGNQGFDQKCAFLGDHRTEAPSDAALESMKSLLAWLADRHGIDTRPGVTVQFVSRGSNKHPAGASVTTPTITGHRTMSATTCPGDAAFTLITDTFPADVSARRDPTAVSSPTTAAPASTTATTAVTTTAAAGAATDPTTSTTGAPETSSTAGGDSQAAPSDDVVVRDGDGDDLGVRLGAGVLAAAVFGAIGVAVVRRRDLMGQHLRR